MKALFIRVYYTRQVFSVTCLVQPDLTTNIINIATDMGIAISCAIDIAIMSNLVVHGWDLLKWEKVGLSTRVNKEQVVRLCGSGHVV